MGTPFTPKRVLLAVLAIMLGVVLYYGGEYLIDARAKRRFEAQQAAWTAEAEKAKKIILEAQQEQARLQGELDANKTQREQNDERITHSDRTRQQSRTLRDQREAAFLESQRPVPAGTVVDIHKLCADAAAHGHPCSE